MTIKEMYNEFNELETVKVWKDGCVIWGEVQTIILGAKTLPFVMVAAGVEVGVKKTKKHIEEKRMERFEVLMKQYESNMEAKATTIGL